MGELEDQDGDGGLDLIEEEEYAESNSEDEDGKRVTQEEEK